MCRLVAVRAEVDARSGPERRQLRYTERLLRSFLEFWQARGCPSPIRAALGLEWVTIEKLGNYQVNVPLFGVLVVSAA